MRKILSICGLAVLLALSGCGKSGQGGDQAAKQADKPDPPSGVVLDADEMQSLGITTVAAQAAQYRAQSSGYGTVVPLDTIAQADSDLLSAEAVAKQSRAEADRDVYLFRDQHGAISRQAMEAATAKAASDEALLTLARRKAQAVFGLAPPWGKSGARGAIMARLATGALALVKVSFPIGTLGEALPKSLSVARLGGSQRWTSNQIWRAPADPAFPGQGLFALIAGSDLSQNEHVDAFVPAGSPQTGVAVPQAAVVYGEGESWIFVRRAAGDFDRVRIDTTRPLANGYFMPDGSALKPGDAIVIGGAGLLLARALNPSTEPTD